MVSPSDADVSGSPPQNDAVGRAVAAFRAGNPVLVHDAADREGETDIIYPARAVTPAAVAHLRNDAGGLVCLALGDDVAETLALPFMDTSLDHPTATDHELGYDSRSSFSLTVNHRDTFTGITDADRSLTITRLGEVAAQIDTYGNYGVDDFASEFRSPGHVHLLRAAPGLLTERQGHTELGIALADAADLPSAAVVCEMLDDETGGALSVVEARAYARRNDFVYVEGRDLITSL